MQQKLYVWWTYRCVAYLRITMLWHPEGKISEWVSRREGDLRTLCILKLTLSIILICSVLYFLFFILHLNKSGPSLRTLFIMRFAKQINSLITASASNKISSGSLAGRDKLSFLSLPIGAKYNVILCWRLHLKATNTNFFQHQVKKQSNLKLAKNIIFL